MTNPTFVSETSPSPDDLRAGEFPTRTDDVTLLEGQNLPAGAVLGKITVGAATAAAVAGNTGTGTIGAVTTGAGAKAGIYRLVCIEPATGAGKFLVEDPDGITVGVATVGVAFSGVLGFTIADGDPDFVSGDAFTITVAAGSKKYKLSVLAATDGSQIPCGILVKPVDATAGDKNAPVYATGEFAKNRLTFGEGHSAETVDAALRALNIYLIDTLPA